MKNTHITPILLALTAACVPHKDPPPHHPAPPTVQETVQEIVRAQRAKERAEFKAMNKRAVLAEQRRRDCPAREQKANDELKNEYKLKVTKWLSVPANRDRHLSIMRQHSATRELVKLIESQKQAQLTNDDKVRMLDNWIWCRIRGELICDHHLGRLGSLQLAGRVEILEFRQLRKAQQNAGYPAEPWFEWRCDNEGALKKCPIERRCPGLLLEQQYYR